MRERAEDVVSIPATTNVLVRISVSGKGNNSEYERDLRKGRELECVIGVEPYFTYLTDDLCISEPIFLRSYCVGSHLCKEDQNSNYSGGKATY